MSLVCGPLAPPLSEQIKDKYDGYDDVHLKHADLEMTYLNALFVRKIVTGKEYDRMALRIINKVSRNAGLRIKEVQTDAN